ncbi:MAG: translation initiation factor IF-2, partial [Pseudomonadota bacterium]|nr:translation initiation factor IF-2 [Pseudomonadota bacterium]
IAEEFGHNVTRVSESDVEVGLSSEEDNDENKTIRPPVVTVMGHVDHGKTSLLDAIRETNNVSGEAGGITQHIGAYQVEVKGGNKITFIDTPGHAAFTAMRARGAKVTDIVILVVAADDSVMPQTVEAINHAKEANVPIIVAINKVDKKDANPTKTKNDLIEHEILVEELGGEIQCVELSAETKIGIPDLVDSIILQAEILDLKANAEISAEGFVIESKLDKGRGPLVTTIIQKGKLKKGDILVVGENWGKVRSLINDKGSEVKDCHPGEPIEVLGLNDTPNAGDTLQVVESEARAREISDYRLRQNKKATPQIPQANLEQMLSKIKDDIKKEIPVIVKADVHGSSEAIREGLLKLGNEEVSCRVIHSGVGEISQSDVTLAEASEAMVLGFNVRANVKAKGLAEKCDIPIVYHSIIYDLLDEVKNLLEGKLDPDLKENIIANAEVLEVFKVSKVGNIAGCKVLDGTVKRDSHGRLIRDGIVNYD